MRIFVALLLAIPAASIAADSPDTATATNQIVIDAPIARLWECFATSEGYKKLGVAQAEVDLRIGGRIRTHYQAAGQLGDENAIEQEILALEPGRMVAVRITRPPKTFPFPGSWQKLSTVMSMTPLGAGRTLVRIAGHGYTAEPESQKMRSFFLKGNAFVLANLKKVLEAESPPAAPAAGDPLDPVEADVLIAAPAKDVYRLLATAEGWRDVTGAAARIELRIGGAFEARLGEGEPEGSMGGEVLSFLPDRMVSFSWSLASDRRHPTHVVITLDEIIPGSTVVRLAHLGFRELSANQAGAAEEVRQARAALAAAWTRALGALKARSERKETTSGPGPAPRQGR